MAPVSSSSSSGSYSSSSSFIPDDMESAHDDDYGPEPAVQEVRMDLEPAASRPPSFVVSNDEVNNGQEIKVDNKINIK